MSPAAPWPGAGWGGKRAWGTLDSPSALGPSQHSPHIPLPPLSAQGAHASDRAGPGEMLRVGFVGASSLLSWGEFGIAGGFSPEVPKFRKSGGHISGAVPLWNEGQACGGVRPIQLLCWGSRVQEGKDTAPGHQLGLRDPPPLWALSLPSASTCMRSGPQREAEPAGSGSGQVSPADGTLLQHPRPARCPWCPQNTLNLEGAGASTVLGQGELCAPVPRLRSS